MLGLVGYGNESDSDASSDAGSSPNERLVSNTGDQLSSVSVSQTVHDGSAAIAVVAKKQKTGGLLSLYESDSEDEGLRDNNHAKNDGPIDIVSSPKFSSVSPVEPDTVPARPLKVIQLSTKRCMNLLPPEPFGDANPAVQVLIHANRRHNTLAFPRDQYRSLSTRNDPHPQAKVVRFLNQSQSFNTALQCSKNFHNPYILSKIAKLYNIDQTGSNYPPDIYNPQVCKTDHKTSSICEAFSNIF